MIYQHWQVENLLSSWQSLISKEVPS